MLIPQPRQLQQLNVPNAGAIAQGIQSGMNMYNQYQQGQAAEQQQQLQGLQLEQAQMQMSEAESKAALGSIAQGAETALNLQGPERSAFLWNRLSQLQQQGKDTEQTMDAVNIGEQYGYDSLEMQRALNEGLQTANSFGVFTPQQQAAKAAQAKQQASLLGEQSDIRKETRSSIGKDLSKIKSDATVYTQNWGKLNNLTKQIKKGNRQAVAPALVSLVKLGDPGSVVSIPEMQGVLNEESPITALLGLGVKNDVAQSLAQKLDLLNPENIDTESLLAAGRAQLGGNIPALQASYNESRLRADENLSPSGVKSLFSKDLDKIVSGLSDLLPSKDAVLAPPAAIQALIDNPQYAQQFKDKYGYLPEGI